MQITTKHKELTGVLDLFFHYAAPDIETFELTVQDFGRAFLT